MPVQAVIMASCSDGENLYPLTEQMPSVLLPVANRHLLSFQLELLERAAGFKQVSVASSTSSTSSTSSSSSTSTTTSACRSPDGGAVFTTSAASSSTPSSPASPASSLSSTTLACRSSS